MTNPLKCPLCSRVRRDDRPLCSNHLRRVGDPVLERYFGLLRQAKRHPGGSAPAKVYAIGNQMIANATAYDDIRALGLRPVWNQAGERWENPRERAATILWNMTRTHRFYDDPDNDAMAIERTAAELYPTE